MAIQKITWDDKVDLTSSNVARINKIIDDDMNEIKSVVNSNADEDIAYQDKIGKILWTGNFDTGTLSVPGISNYTMIAIKSNTLLMVGNQSYGGGLFGAYGTMSINSYAYRFNYDSVNETIKTDSNNKGATDGANQLSITEIIGII